MYRNHIDRFGISFFSVNFLTEDIDQSRSAAIARQYEDLYTTSFCSAAVFDHQSDKVFFWSGADWL
jgi:hypothetical protein